MTLFLDRVEAGRRLARLLHAFRGEPAVVLGLPRGGVAVAWEIARTLDLPLDVVVVRKLGAPGNPELGMGAVAEGGGRYLDPSIVQSVGATPGEVEAITHRAEAEVARRVQRFRGARPPLSVAGRTALVVDDGVATGGTATAALRAVRARAPARVVLAVPVASRSSLATLRAECDDIVCVEPVDVLWAVGASYVDFAPVEEDRVVELLALARARTPQREEGRAQNPPP